MGIFNANSVGIGNANFSLPNMSATLESWFQNIAVGLVTKSQQNNRTVETVTEHSTRGVLQPLSVKELLIKPEGQRSWKWYMLHCQASLSLKNDDTVTIKGSRYRVMGHWGFNEYGFVQYELVQDYETVMEAIT